MLIEQTTTGGQAGQSSRIENYLGFPDGVSGASWPTSARRQAEKFGAEVITARKAVALEVNGTAAHDRFDDGGTIDAHAVILATGVAYRKLDGARAATTMLQLRSRRLLRRVACPIAVGVRGRGRLRRRRRQLGGPGGDVSVPQGQIGDDARARRRRWRRRCRTT